MELQNLRDHSRSSSVSVLLSYWGLYTLLGTQVVCSGDEVLC
jgi:hypothetical protein